MTYPSAQAWSPAPVETGRRLTAIDVGAMAAGVLLLLIFSQGWITPIFGDKGMESAGSLIRAAFFPAYLCGLAILAVSALLSHVGFLPLFRH